MSEKTRFLVEFTNDEGDTTGHICDDAAQLGNFVRVNANDAGLFRIIKMTDDLLVRDAVAEAIDT